MSYYPKNAGELLQAAELVLALALNPGTPPALLARLKAGLEALARAYVDAVAAQRGGISAQDAARAARDVSDDLTDRKGKAFFQACRYGEGGAALMDELQRAWGGGRMSAAFNQPDADQVNTFDRFFALIDARADLSLPRAAYDEFKAAHEDMKAKVRAEEAADAARDTFAAQVQAAGKAFGPAYRFLIRDLLFNEGEDLVRDHLPRFAR